MVAAGLGEIATGSDAELDAKTLQQDRHQVRDEDDGEEGVSKFGPAGEIGRPVARVHVADGYEKAGAGEGGQLSPKRRLVGNDDAAMDFREGNVAAAASPPAGWLRALGGHFQHRDKAVALRFFWSGGLKM